MAELGIPQFGVPLCVIPFAPDVDLETMSAIITNFTTFKHQYLEGELEAAFPNYFIGEINKELGDQPAFDEAIVTKYKSENNIEDTPPASGRLLAGESK